MARQNYNSFFLLEYTFSRWAFSSRHPVLSANAIVFDCASRRGTGVSATRFNHCGHTPENLLVLPSRGEGGLPPRPRPFTFDGLVSLHKNALDVRQWAWKKFSVYISSVLMKLSFVHSFASNLLLMAHARANVFSAS